MPASEDIFKLILGAKRLMFCLINLYTNSKSKTYPKPTRVVICSDSQGHNINSITTLQSEQFMSASTEPSISAIVLYQLKYLKLTNFGDPIFKLK